MKKLAITSLIAILTTGAAYAAVDLSPDAPDAKVATSKQYVDSGLSKKANKTEVQSALDLKANVSSLTGLASQEWVQDQNYLTTADVDVSGKANAVATGTGTGTKVTVNAQGIVTGTTDAGISDISGLQSALDLKANASSLTGLASQTWVESQNYLTTADVDVTGKADAVATGAGTGTKLTVNAQGIVTGTTDAGIADITGLQTALNNKQNALTCQDGQIMYFNGNGTYECRVLAIGEYTGE